MDNTVGSASIHFWDLFSKKDNSYILGLWCADGYHRTSSIGISNVNRKIISRFFNFLLKYYAKERIKLKIYHPPFNYPDVNAFKNFSDNIALHSSVKAKQLAFHLYVNSRPLLRFFQQAKTQIYKFNQKKAIIAYFAGRFDGDGSIAKDLRSDCRIVYGNKQEAESDKALLRKIDITNTKVYEYKSAKTYCLYISRYEANRFLNLIKQYSVIVPKNVYSHPVETSLNHNKKKWR